MQSRAGHLYALVMAFSLAILYGSTYQQFRFFSLDAPGGASDAIIYVQMSQGDFGVDAHHRYRWLTPTAARLIHPAVEKVVRDGEFATRLSFYIVNFAFSLVACVALFALFRAMRFSVPLSLLGICAFASSRTTVLATATPMADAAFFCAVAVLSYLVVARKSRTIVVLLPVLVLSKETALLFLLLPLLTDQRRSGAYWAAVAVSLLVFAMSRQAIDSLYPVNASSLYDAVLEHVVDVPQNLGALLTLKGLHDLQSGFSFLLPIAAAGAWVNLRYKYRVVQNAVLATVPIGLGLAMLSGNLGRMFFVAFPAVIAYALIAIEHASRSREPDDSAS